jgi:hypothetical protein
MPRGDHLGKPVGNKKAYVSHGNLESSVLLKYLLVIPYWVLQWMVAHAVVALIVMDHFSLDDWTEVVTDLDYVRFTVLSCGVISALQFVLLFPVRTPTGRASQSTALSFSVAAAAVGGAALAGGILLGLAGLHDLVIRPADMNLLHVDAFWWSFWACAALSWFVCWRLGAAYMRRGPMESRLGRLVAWIFAGSVVETVALIPLEVMIRRRLDCYCDRGGFWSIVLCVGVGLYTLGPATLLHVLARRRRAWYAGHCRGCGYDFEGLTGGCCPECGSPRTPLEIGGASSPTIPAKTP